jgi:hypothetical protein
MPWGDGILEYWSSGFRRMSSFFDTFGKSEINNLKTGFLHAEKQEVDTR